MQPIAGFSPTGRSTIGPGADLVEFEGEDGYRHTGLVFHPECREHPAINSALDVVVDFLESPYVTGLLELVAHDHDEGAFIYPTGQAWSASEVVRSLADTGQVAGVRAGLELMFAAGQVLVEAAESGESHGIYSHGGLTPWRVMLKADGQVEILGYALPQVEILLFQSNNRDVPKEDSFRYCPPERMEGASEELSADLFALALIAFEFMTGKPVYDGLVNDIRTQASRGEGSRRLFRFKDQLPGAVSELLKTCLRAQPDDRHPDGDAFLDDVQAVLATLETGEPLMDVMDRVSAQQRRIGEGLDDGKTMGMSRDDIKRMLGEETGDAEPAEPKRATAWAPPSKKRRRRTAARLSTDKSRDEGPTDPAPEPDPDPVADPSEQAAAKPEPDPPPDPTKSSGRWGKPGRGRRSRPNKRAAPPEEDLEGPVDSGAIAPGAVALDKSADDIIRRISTSSDEHGPARDDGRTASDVLDAILSSTAGDDPSLPPRKRQKRRRRRSSPKPEAAELAPPSPVAPPSRPELTEAPVAFGAAPLPDEDSAVAQTSKPVASEPMRGVSAPAEPAIRQLSPSSVRPPDPLPASRGGKALTFRIIRGPGGTTVKTRIPGGFTLAAAVAFLTGTLVPVRTDLQGRVRLGYRLGDRNGPFPGDTVLSSLDGDQPLTLHPVAVREVWVRVEVRGDPPTVFRTPVSTVLTVATVCDALTTWLELEPGKWFLLLGEQPLSPHLLLDELNLSGATLVLTR